jgi:hypothetical protein
VPRSHTVIKYYTGRIKQAWFQHTLKLINTFVSSFLLSHTRTVLWLRKSLSTFWWIYRFWASLLQKIGFVCRLSMFMLCMCVCMYTCLATVCMAGRILFTFGIQEFIHPSSVPYESVHSSSKSMGPSNGPQNTLKTAPTILIEIHSFVDTISLNKNTCMVSSGNYRHLN